MANSLESLISKIKTLPVVKQRAISALLGATVADAATRPLHWIYNQDTLNDLLATSSEPEFWPESKSPFYTIPLGWASGYNDAAFVTLTSLSQKNGEIDIGHICEKFNCHFGTGSIYHDALLRRKAAYEGGKRPGPIDGPWIQQAVVKFLENYAKRDGGALGDSENKEFDGFCAALPIIVKYTGKPDMWDNALNISSLLNTNSEATKMFHTTALMVSYFISGIDDPVVHVKEAIKSLYPDIYKLICDVEACRSDSYIPTIAKFGKACSLPGSFQGAILTMLNTSSFTDAIRLNITGGGCNCSRANVIGACYGAKFGVDGIPLDWLKKVKDIEKVIEMVIKVVTCD